jgi:hypothetical protein
VKWPDPLREMLHRSGITKLVGPDLLFKSTNVAVQYMQQAQGVLVCRDSPTQTPSRMSSASTQSANGGSSNNSNNNNTDGNNTIDDSLHNVEGDNNV